MATSHFASLVEPADRSVYDMTPRRSGPSGTLPLTDELLRNAPSGDLFGWTMNVGMGWKPEHLGGKEFLILSTNGGLRADDGSPIALGYHTGHWEVGLLVKAAAMRIRELGGVPFAGAVTDPCDGRTQGTAGMFDSLPYRNDASMVFRRLIRSLPTRSGVLGVATCDKGLPAMMMALASCHDMPAVLVPGGVMLAGDAGSEDTGKVQSIGARYSNGELTLEQAAEAGCRACASPGGGCQFLGTAATSQVVGEALGMALPHSALSPSGQPVWLDMASRSATALATMANRGIRMPDILTDASVRNAITVHAAFGGSTNLLLHIPAVAFHAGLSRPTLDDWVEINRTVPRLVDALPNGPMGHPTIFVFLAGGVPEVMLHLRDLGLLELDALTVTGEPLGQTLDWWQGSERRAILREKLRADGIDPETVIYSPEAARRRALTSTVTFPRGNIAPNGSVIKSTSIDPSVVDADGVYRKTGPAKVFVSEEEAVAAIKGHGSKRIEPGDVIVLCGRGPMGTGMEETYQLTSALRYLSWGKSVAVVTDARFSGVSTGACLGHVSPEGLAGGPIGKLFDGDRVRIVVDRNRLEGSIDLVGDAEREFGPEVGERILADRRSRVDMVPDPKLPADTRLWAVLQNASGGVWGGCVYDPEIIAGLLLS